MKSVRNSLHNLDLQATYTAIVRWFCRSVSAHSGSQEDLAQIGLESKSIQMQPNSEVVA